MQDEEAKRLSEGTREFAQAILGRPVPSRNPEVIAREKLAQLEWLATFSPRHEEQLRRLRREEAKAREKQEHLAWLASISAVNEAEWDPAKHPRGGFSQNRGWFSSSGSSGAQRAAAQRATDAMRASASLRPVPPRMLELADKWWHKNEELQKCRTDIAQLPRKIAEWGTQFKRGGRYSYLYKQYIAQAERDLESAKAQLEVLEPHLREIEQEYRQAGYNDIDYSTWTRGETIASGRGIEQVGNAVQSAGLPAGLQPTGIEFDIALGALSVRQLGKAALKKGATKSTAKTPLDTRVKEVHGTIDRIAQSQRTTAVLETADGTRIVASGGRDLTPAQRALLGPGEIAAKSPGSHAELTALEHAVRSGLRPSQINASRPFCPECIKAIESAGGKITSPTTAEFPR